MTPRDFGAPVDTSCPKCGGEHLSHSVESQPVRFGYGPGDVLMSTVDVEVPVTWCKDCEEGWTDARAEALRIEAVERRREELRA